MDSEFVGFIIGPVFIVLGSLVIYFIGDKATLQCQRPTASQVNCTLTNASLRRTKTQNLPGNQLQGAEVLRYRDSDGDRSYQVMLRTVEGNVPLTPIKSSGARGKRRQAEQINTFLADPQQRELTIIQDDRWFAFGLGGLFVVVGAGIAIATLMGFK
jgi:hypothetical protein